MLASQLLDVLPVGAIFVLFAVGVIECLLPTPRARTNSGPDRPSTTGVRASLIGEGGTEATGTLGARPDGRDDEP